MESNEVVAYRCACLTCSLLLLGAAGPDPDAELDVPFFEDVSIIC